MSSGSYHPPPVQVVEIPKGNGKIRRLGIPTVGDRIAQMVVKLYIEPKLEPIFHEDSYGYRPNKSAIEAVGKARERCWKYNWVLDLDIKGFFDNIDHELLMKAVRHQIKEKWILLYIERWLKASAKETNGEIVERDKGTPQGGVISPLLANLFLHYAFDKWMERNNPEILFERYADDIIIHCKTKMGAEKLKHRIEQRLKECKLELHPEKTKMVYCKDGNRREDYPLYKFDFLGYTFRPRMVRVPGRKFFIGFNPAVSNKAKKALRDKLRKLKLQRRTMTDINSLAKIINPILQGWINYFCKYYKSEMKMELYRVNNILVKWAKRKYKNFRGCFRKAEEWMTNLSKREPNLFVHWKLGINTAAGR
jgi:RNA-directed DNA polymerase